MSTATQQMMRQDLRRVRAMALTHAIMHALRPYLVDEYRAEAEAYRALETLFREHGAEMITDDMRREYGLPPRGPDGWTMEEVVALEARRLEYLARPIKVEILQVKP